MVKMKGLGRGLDALLAGDRAESKKDALHTLSIDRLQPGKYQPRTHMDKASLVELAESIKSQGIIQPILARALPHGDYEIIAGERRWRAARLAGLSEVPVLVREVPDEAALAMSLIENIQRENLNPLEEAAGIQRLISEFSMTHQLAAEAVGRSRSAVTNLLRLLNLVAPVQEMLMHSQIDMGHARALLALPSAMQITAAHEISSKKLSVREAEKMVQRIQQPEQKTKPRPDPDIVRLQEDLAQHLGTTVSLKAQKKGSGKLIISYDSLDRLDAILARLGLK